MSDTDEIPRINGRDIYEVANQLEGYVDTGTPDRLAQFLLREGKAACDLADEIVRLQAEVERLEIELVAAQPLFSRRQLEARISQLEGR